MKFITKTVLIFAFIASVAATPLPQHDYSDHGLSNSSTSTSDANGAYGKSKVPVIHKKKCHHKAITTSQAHSTTSDASESKPYGYQDDVKPIEPAHTEEPSPSAATCTSENKGLVHPTSEPVASDSSASENDAYTQSDSNPVVLPTKSYGNPSGYAKRSFDLDEYLAGCKEY